MASIEKLEHQAEESTQEQLDLNSSLRNIAYWESSLFSKVYLDNDLKRDFSEKWDRDYDDQVFDENGDTVKSGFYHFYNEFRNIAESLRSLSKKNISETDTITKIIVPVLNALGWYDNCSNNVDEPYAAETSFTVKEKDKGRTYRTDMILVDYPQEAGFINNQTDSEKRKREARQYCIAPLEAKYWNRILEKEKSNIREDKKRADNGADDTGLATSFNEQVLNYMNILHKKWGIVTDGNIWRLVNSEISGEATDRCFEFRLESLLDQEGKIESGTGDDNEFLENAKYFYLFFGKASFLKDDFGKVFLDEVLKESRKYIDSIEEDLKDRFIAAMNITCDGLLKAAQKKGTITTPSDSDLSLIRTVAESHLFNILFIKSCEARNILPIKSPNYYQLSLTGIIDRISVFDPEKYTSNKDKEYIEMRLSKSLKIYNYKLDGNGLYKNLIRLTELIHDGAGRDDFGFEIKGFRESVFSPEEWQFAKRHSLSDQEMVKIFFELGYSKARSSLQRNYQKIPYNYFTPRQLGSIYESFLEYRLDIATSPMVFLQKGKYKQWVKRTVAIERKMKGYEPVVMKGQTFFTPDNSERKATGSYYTPDFIVQFIVEKTLDPILEHKTSDEIKKVKICDPAMGSGHFLIASLNKITSAFLVALEKEVDSDQMPSRNEARREILDKCIFGVDINPRAVKLAKMSLWLESAHWGRKLERLDDQLKVANSLVETKIWNEYADLHKSGFHAVVGNPPYLGEKGNKEAFREVRTGSEFGERTYKRKMDYFYWFIMKGVELLKESGRLSYITTNYWVTADGAQTLKENLISSGAITEYIDFLDATIFESAPGQCSSILIFEKGKSWDDEEIELRKATERLQKDPTLLGDIQLDIEDLFETSLLKLHKVCPSQGEWTIGSRESTSITPSSSSHSAYNFSQEDFEERIGKDSVCMGVQTAADKVTKSLLKMAVEKGNLSQAKANSEYEIGDGIYVIDYRQALKLSNDKSVIKKFFKNSSIGYYYYDSSSYEGLIYVDSEIEISKFPNIKDHLKKYRPLLASREQANNDENNWYWIRGSKRDKIFGRETIVCPYRTKTPKFSLSCDEVYGAGDIYYINDFKGFSSTTFLGYLNSSFVVDWLSRFGKRKGEMYELYQTPLSNIPVPKYSKDDAKRVDLEVKNIFKNLNEIEKSKLLPPSSIKGFMDSIAVYKGQSNENLKSVDTALKKYVKEISSSLELIDNITYSVMVKKKSGAVA